MAPARFSITHTADNSMKKVICGERKGTDCQFLRLSWYFKTLNKQKNSRMPFFTSLNSLCRRISHTGFPHIGQRSMTFPVICEICTPSFKSLGLIRYVNVFFIILCSPRLHFFKSKIHHKQLYCEISLQFLINVSCF